MCAGETLRPAEAEGRACLTQSAFINKTEDVDGEFPGTFPRFALTPLTLDSSSDPGEITAIICMC